MAKVLVLYYSSYGHIERMAVAEADGARSAGADVDIKRVPELVPNKVALASHYKLDQIAPVATIDDLINYDAIIFGTPTRFGNMAAQMKNFIDQAGGLWAKDKLVGKVGSVFTASATQHGGQEATILSFHIVLLHLGFIVVGLALFLQRPVGHQGRAWCDSLWRHDDRRCRRRAHAVRAGDRSGAVSGPSRRRDRGWLPPRTTAGRMGRERCGCSGMRQLRP
jgi:NAD(P)H dehydrogenase (quinone)